MCQARLWWIPHDFQPLSFQNEPICWVLKPLECYRRQRLPSWRPSIGETDSVHCIVDLRGPDRDFQACLFCPEGILGQTWSFNHWMHFCDHRTRIWDFRHNFPDHHCTSTLQIFILPAKCGAADSHCIEAGALSHSDCRSLWTPRFQPGAGWGIPELFW